MQTGENEQGLRKILDLTRMMSIAILLLHFYYYCYEAFNQWEIRSDITDRLLQNIYNTGLFSNFHKSKLIALIVLIISLFGARGRKDEKLMFKTAVSYILTGLILFFELPAFEPEPKHTDRIADVYGHNHFGVCFVSYRRNLLFQNH